MEKIYGLLAIMLSNRGGFLQGSSAVNRLWKIFPPDSGIRTDGGRTWVGWCSEVRTPSFRGCLLRWVTFSFHFSSPCCVAAVAAAKVVVPHNCKFNFFLLLKLRLGKTSKWGFHFLSISVYKSFYIFFSGFAKYRTRQLSWDLAWLWRCVRAWAAAKDTRADVDDVFMNTK